MRLKISLCFYFFLFIIMLGMIPIMSRVYALETNTTLYLGSIEKTLETGESKVYYSLGNTTVVRNIKQDGSSTVSYLHQDHLGSTILITNDKGNVAGPSLAYYPYGNLTSDQKQLTIDKLYTGQRKDTSSDLYFYNARYYNPITAHFVSADKAQGANRYAYVANNPVMKNDPTGNVFEEGTGGGVGGDDFDVLVKQWNEQDRLVANYRQSSPDESLTRSVVTVAKMGGVMFGASAAIEAMMAVPAIYSAAAPYALSGIIGTQQLLGNLKVQLGLTAADVTTTGACLAGVSPACALNDVIGVVGAIPAVPHIQVSYEDTNRVFGRVAGTGTYGRVYVEGGTATKIFDSMNHPEIDYQIETLQKFGGGLLPSLTGIVYDLQGTKIGYQMETINGVQLDTFLRKKGNLSQQAVDTALAELDSLHGRGFIHRDVYHNNIMVEEGGRIRLIDPYGVSINSIFNTITPEREMVSFEQILIGN